MLRKGDRVAWEHGIARVVDVDGVTALLSSGVHERPDRLDLLCTRCNSPATRFTEAGAAACDEHAGPLAATLAVRPDPQALIHCACGEALDGAKSEGIWTIAEVACEYRTCPNCGSTRAWAPHDQIAGREAAIYADPDTSEVYRSGPSFLDLLSENPPSPWAAIVRNGVTLARVYCGVDGVHGWRVMPPEHESPCTIRPKRAI